LMPWVEEESVRSRCDLMVAGLCPVLCRRILPATGRPNSKGLTVDEV
jgi:hypothetical protein